MQTGRKNFVSSALERAFPERRLFLRSDTETRFVRLTPLTQAVAITGSALVVGWTILASAVVLMDSIGAGHLKEQTAREQRLYEARLNEISTERERALAEAGAAQSRFTAALSRVSEMQTELLASEARREELELGMDIAHASLKKAILDRDAARAEATRIARRLEGDPEALRDVARLEDMQETIELLSATLSSTAGQRDTMASDAEEAESFAEEQLLEAKLVRDRNDRIFDRIEDALTISVKPLDKMFRAAGLDTDNLLDSVRRDYSGQGGPTAPITFSTKGEPASSESLRANDILDKLDRMNLYRLAAEKSPFAMPVYDSFRYTSGFGARWGRMHEGADMAGAHGTSIYATADGVVTFAGRMSGYGNLVKIKHDFGLETRYAHMARLRVAVGQRVSRGEQIGDMGNTGRSTGTHLHYEVRVGGTPVDPMTYIKAGEDVF